MMKRLSKVQIFFIGVSILYFASGCTITNLPDSSFEGEPRKTPTATFIVPVTSEPDPLDGTRWMLVAFEGEEMIPTLPGHPQFFVEFRKGELSLQGGCNSVGGHYVLENDRITITFAEATEVDCSFLGPNINEVELAFSTAMLTFDSFMLEGDGQLRIRYMDGELLFHRVAD